MVSKYRSVLAVPGAARLFATALVARLPQGMALQNLRGEHAQLGLLGAIDHIRVVFAAPEERGIRVALAREIAEFVAVFL